MSKQIIEGVSKFVTLPEGGKGLDVGCGSGALTIAVAKRNPQAENVTSALSVTTKARSGSVPKAYKSWL